MQKFGLIEELVDPSEFLDSAPVTAANDFDRSEVEAEVADWREANM